MSDIVKKFNEFVNYNNSGKLKKNTPINGKLVNTLSPQRVGGMKFGIYEMPNGGFAHEFSDEIFSDYPEATNDLQYFINELIRDYNEDVIHSNNIDDYYEIEYYLRVGEHGHVKSYKTFDTAYKEGLKFLETERGEGNLNDDDVLYIGIHSNTNKFAILYISKEYLKILNKSAFSDVDGYDKFVETANKYLEEKKPQIAEF